MKFCQHCGKQLVDEAVVCIECGCFVQSTPVAQQTGVDNSVSAGLVILAVLIPLFGIIYWGVQAKTRPKCAKACGVAAIISAVSPLVIFFGFLLLMAMAI